MAKKQSTAVTLDIAKLEELRKSLDMSMEDAARAAGLVSRQRWYAIVSGTATNVELSTLNQIAEALGVNAKELLK